MKKLLIFIFIVLMGITTNAQESNSPYAKDVASIDAIIKAYYDVFSGSSSDAWQFNRDKFIHSNQALITRFPKKGKAVQHSLEAEYIPVLSVPREDFYEVELHRITEHYGNMAHVWSTFEIRTNPEESTDRRGINSISLFYSEGRWWIGSWATQHENDKPLPKRYLPKSK